uniref:Uncharacterized protein n=1 Tax=Salix viminalis TaxID=40686 RepID=A0A6N2KH68_SALVM
MLLFFLKKISRASQKALVAGWKASVICLT